ncbi:MAG: SPOR domain-containing protein [Candidatus Cloacimonetes bacterium]|jgi:cell division septation protein DedD|nr:SPOR domain-containing protein [Candidatus Cloacimonadota bacterium]
MRNVLQLIVIIIAVVAIIIIIGFVIGTVTHNMKSESDEKIVEQPVNIEEISDPLLPEFEELFSLQIMASSKYDNIKSLQDKLKQENYETEISKLMRDGIIIYRLRLAGLYDEDDAIGLGEELKKQYTSIDGYWLEEQKTRTTSTFPQEEKVKTEEVSKEEQAKSEYEKEIKITKKKIDFGKECEVQMLASSNYARIEQIKTDLDRKGYKTKILTFTKDKNIIYRLRLRGLYSEAEGKRLGNELVKLSPHVSSFWLDEIIDGKSVGQIGATVTKTSKTAEAYASGDFEIQILANTKRNFVEDKKSILEKAGYRAKIATTTKNGTRYYRLRLADSYARSEATKMGDKLKKEVRFVSDYWIVPKSGVSAVAPRTTKQKPKVQDESLTEPIQYPIDPKYQSKNTKQQKTMTCNSDDINIRIGPGTYYAIDPIGKLMKGVTVFVVDEKNDWIKFTITPNDESWAGWVDKKYLK